MSYNNQVLLGVVSQGAPIPPPPTPLKLLAPSKKGPSSLLQFGLGENICGRSNEGRAY